MTLDERFGIKQARQLVEERKAQEKRAEREASFLVSQDIKCEKCGAEFITFVPVHMWEKSSRMFESGNVRCYKCSGAVKAVYVEV